MGVAPPFGRGKRRGGFWAVDTGDEIYFVGVMRVLEKSLISAPGTSFFHSIWFGLRFVSAHRYLICFGWLLSSA